MEHAAVLEPEGAGGEVEIVATDRHPTPGAQRVDQRDELGLAVGRRRPAVEPRLLVGGAGGEGLVAPVDAQRVEQVGRELARAALERQRQPLLGGERRREGRGLGAAAGEPVAEVGRRGEPVTQPQLLEELGLVGAGLGRLGRRGAAREGADERPFEARRVEAELVEYRLLLARGAAALEPVDRRPPVAGVGEGEGRARRRRGRRRRPPPR